MDYCAQGNTLAGPDVVGAMARSFESSSGPLAERLMDALDAAQGAGGDKRGMQSAALLILKPLAGAAGYSDRVLDLRVDEHAQPLAELRRVLGAFRARRSVGDVRRAIASGDLQAALAAAFRTRDLFPEGDGAWVAIADVQLRMGNRAEALDALRRAVELNPANKRQLPLNDVFAALHDAPEFQRLVQ